MVVGTMVELKP